MEVQTISRRWARRMWLCWLGTMGSFLASYFVEEEAAGALVVIGGIFTLASLLCGRKLRCPYCRKGLPWKPRLWTSEKIDYCPNCGKAFVYDDEVDREH